MQDKVDIGRWCATREGEVEERMVEIGRSESHLGNDFTSFFEIGATLSNA
jgi:hypothetical protein